MNILFCWIHLHEVITSATSLKTDIPSIGGHSWCLSYHLYSKYLHYFFVSKHSFRVRDFAFAFILYKRRIISSIICKYIFKRSCNSTLEKHLAIALFAYFVHYYSLILVESLCWHVYMPRQFHKYKSILFRFNYIMSVLSQKHSIVFFICVKWNNWTDKN